VQNKTPIFISAAIILALLYITASYGQQTRPYDAHNLTLSEPYKEHQIYELAVKIPASWKIDESFQDDDRLKQGSLMAIDLSKDLDYPRNLEIRVIPENIHADSNGREHLQKYLKMKFVGGHRGIKQYKTDGAEFIKVGPEKSEDALLLFSSFLLGDSKMSHIHLAIPRNGYYFLFIYTDIKSRVADNSSESFDVFWNIVSHIQLPQRSIWSNRNNAMFMLAAFFVLMLLSLCLFFIFHKKSFKKKLSRLIRSFDYSENTTPSEVRSKIPRSHNPQESLSISNQPTQKLQVTTVSLDKKLSEVIKHPSEELTSSLWQDQTVNSSDDHEKTILSQIIGEKKDT